jgi:hypothetical protein
VPQVFRLEVARFSAKLLRKKYKGLADAPVYAARSMAQTLAEIILTGALDRLVVPGTRFTELSYSRMGGMADERVAVQLLEELKRRGWARDSEDIPRCFR